MRNRNFDRRMVTILAIVFAQFVGASMVLPILPLYAKRQFALSPEIITLLISSFFIAQFLAAPVLGRLSDTYGRVPVLIASQIGTVISFIMLAFAGTAWVLFASRILDGITGGNIIVAQAYVTDITPRERRTQALGLIFAALGLGFVFGPALGGILSSALGPRAPFIVAAIGTAIPVILTWRNLEETLTPERREQNRQKGKQSLNPGQVMTNLPLMLILFAAFIGQFGLGLVQATFALFGEAVLFSGAEPETTDLGIGLLLAAVGFGQLFTQLYLLQRLTERFGEAPLVIIGTILRGISMYTLALIVSPWLAFPSVLLFAMGGGLMMPALQSLSTDTVGDELRGAVLGLYQSAFSLSIIFSTAIGGTLFSISPQTPYWIGGTLFMVTIIPALYVYRWAQRVRGEAVPAGTD